MTHYHNCLVGTFDWHRNAHHVVNSGTRSLIDFQRDCLEPLEIANCEGAVHEDKVTITAKIRPFLARSFVNNVSHIPLEGGQRFDLDHFDFSNTAKADQVSWFGVMRYEGFL